MPENIDVRMSDRTLWITLDRPDQMNALNRELVSELADALREAESDHAVHVIVITGAGRAFCAGADLLEAQQNLTDMARFREGLLTWRDAFALMETVTKPVIGAVNGVALAGGLELALACDVMVASSQAKLGDVHARYGLVPGGGGSQRLPDAVGTRWARWLMYTGAVLTADEALNIGLVQAVYPHEQFMEQVGELARTMSLRSGPGLAFMKRMSTSPRVTPAGIERELEAAVNLISGPDAQEGLAAFAAKREPSFGAGPGGH